MLIPDIVRFHIVASKSDAKKINQTGAEKRILTENGISRSFKVDRTV